MRLQKVEKGDGLLRSILIKTISTVSGMRLPDAARIVMYHKNFYGRPMTTWTQAAMRGESNWSVGERELFAAMTAKWNQCPFCIEAHGAIASLVLDKTLIQAALYDSQQTTLPHKLQTILGLLQLIAKTPDELTRKQVDTVLQQGISVPELEDAIAIVALFSITVRCANAFGFELLGDEDQVKAAKRMLSQGYIFGGGKPEDHPNHAALAEGLRKRILEGPGLTDTNLRKAIAKRAAGGPFMPEQAYDKLALHIGQSSYKITDDLIKEVIRKSGSEKGAFELITTAAVGAGLYRWQAGIKFLQHG